MNQTQRKAGRPPKVQGRLNNKLVAVRMDDLLYECVAAEAREAGFKDIQDLIRQILTARVFQNYMEKIVEEDKYTGIDDNPANVEPLISFYDDHYKRLNDYFDYLDTWKDATRRAQLKYAEAKGKYLGWLEHRKKFSEYLKDEIKRREDGGEQES